MSGLMSRDRLFELAEEHAATVWGEDKGPLGAGDAVLNAHAIDKVNAAELALTVVEQGHGLDTEAGIAAVFMQGFIFGLWLADQRAGLWCCTLEDREALSRRVEQAERQRGNFERIARKQAEEKHALWLWRNEHEPRLRELEALHGEQK